MLSDSVCARFKPTGNFFIIPFRNTNIWRPRIFSYLEIEPLHHRQTLIGHNHQRHGMMASRRLKWKRFYRSRTPTVKSKLKTVCICNGITPDMVQTAGSRPRADLAACFEGAKWCFERGQTVQRSLFFPCNAIDIMLKLSIVWWGPNLWKMAMAPLDPPMSGVLLMWCLPLQRVPRSRTRLSQRCSRPALVSRTVCVRQIHPGTPGTSPPPRGEAIASPRPTSDL